MSDQDIKKNVKSYRSYIYQCCMSIIEDTIISLDINESMGKEYYDYLINGNMHDVVSVNDFIKYYKQYYNDKIAFLYYSIHIKYINYAKDSTSKAVTMKPFNIGPLLYHAKAGRLKHVNMIIPVSSDDVIYELAEYLADNKEINDMYTILTGIIKSHPHVYKSDKVLKAVWHISDIRYKNSKYNIIHHALSIGLYVNLSIILNLSNDIDKDILLWVKNDIYTQEDINYISINNMVLSKIKSIAINIDNNITKVLDSFDVVDPYALFSNNTGTTKT